MVIVNKNQLTLTGKVCAMRHYLGTSFPHALETKINPEMIALAAFALLAQDPASQA
jgi:hypothetical protein